MAIGKKRKRKAKSSPKRRPVAKPKSTQKKSTQKKRPRPEKLRPRKPAPRAPKLSRHPEAVRSRARRREAKAIWEAQEVLRAERAERRRDKRRQKRREPPNERALAIGWLEYIRNAIAGLYAVSLELTEPEPGATTPWLVVGRYDFIDHVGYQELGEALQWLENDVVLEAMIHPDRLSQIRIVYNDPRAKRGEGDSIVSQAGAWNFIVSSLVGEILGGSADDEDALAVRYEATQVPTFYIYFSSEIVQYVTAGPWARTQTVRLR